MNELEMAIHHQMNGPKPPYHVLLLKVPIQKHTFKDESYEHTHPLILSNIKLRT